MVKFNFENLLSKTATFSPWKTPEVKSGPVGVRAKDGSPFSPWAAPDTQDGPVGVRPKDGSEQFSPFKAGKAPDGPVGVVPKDGSKTFSPWKVADVKDGPVHSSSIFSCNWIKLLFNNNLIQLQLKIGLINLIN